MEFVKHTWACPKCKKVQTHTIKENNVGKRKVIHCSHCEQNSTMKILVPGEEKKSKVLSILGEKQCFIPIIINKKHEDKGKKHPYWKGIDASELRQIMRELQYENKIEVLLNGKQKVYGIKVQEVEHV